MFTLFSTGWVSVYILSGTFPNIPTLIRAISNLFPVKYNDKSTEEICTIELRKAIQFLAMIIERVLI